MPQDIVKCVTPHLPLYAEHRTGLVLVMVEVTVVLVVQAPELWAVAEEVLVATLETEETDLAEEELLLLALVAEAVADSQDQPALSVPAGVVVVLEFSDRARMALLELPGAQAVAVALVGLMVIRVTTEWLAVAFAVLTLVVHMAQVVEVVRCPIRTTFQ